MLCEEKRVSSAIDVHSCIGLFAAEINIHDIINCIDGGGLAGGLDLLRTLHAVILAASCQYHDEGYDKKIFHGANIGNDEELYFITGRRYDLQPMMTISTMYNIDRM